jgi:hypothetical protein
VNNSIASVLYQKIHLLLFQENPVKERRQNFYLASMSLRKTKCGYSVFLCLFPKDASNRCKGERELLPVVNLFVYLLKLNLKQQFICTVNVGKYIYPYICSYM